MLAALTYPIVPPFILGRLKQPVARRIQDMVVHTDALMQKADWMTGAAASVGIIGVGFGLWWADAAETGRYIVADLCGVTSAPHDADRRNYGPGEQDRAWRLAGISFIP